MNKMITKYKPMIGEQRYKLIKSLFDEHKRFKKELNKRNIKLNYKITL